ncbi:MAG: acetolactate synthase I/II/III large subunit [Candidatus Tokpelaia sp. JSC161]|jgi:acetolactate synthase-1/2/3 large subunit|nr:MAG: acetolactate synthase I/II/III large subunit [Candidatus Tokpelaia sp. JSC161]
MKENHKTAEIADSCELSGAKIVIQALLDQGVEHVFGYPGGSVLPIFDEIYQQNKVRHILVRHEQAAGHAAEGYARTTGKVGVFLVTSGPGATNAVTPLQDALMDSIPVVCIAGQVSTALIGSDAFQEADTISITRSCTKHNWLVRNVNDLSDVIHKAFFVASSGRPGPVLIDIPKDIQLSTAIYLSKKSMDSMSYGSLVQNVNLHAVNQAVDLLVQAHKPIIYSGGGVITSGLKAVRFLRELVKIGNFPITSTLMGLGAYPANSANWLGMLGMHGTYEANMAMHDCDVMLAVGARFDDRITGRLDAFAPDAKIIHIDIDPLSFNKNVRVDIPILGDVADILDKMVSQLLLLYSRVEKVDLNLWWKEITRWRARNSLAYQKKGDVIMPQYAIERLWALTKDYAPYLTTEVGQHQMWTAQFFGFDEPNHWMTSGGLGTMGYGFPAAIGVQIARPNDLVICVAGDASIQMNIQELSTAIQHDARVKVFILNNQYMGMVRQWQELLYGNRLSHSYMEAIPDFVKLAEAYGAVGIQCSRPDDLDSCICEMVACKKPVLLDCRVVNLVNCLPMIPSGSAHNEMLLQDEIIVADG